MKTFRLFLVTILTAGIFGIYSFAQPSPVSSYLIDPAYPAVGQQVTIYVNANYFGLTTDNGHLSAWTGVITSASSNLSNWLHNPISNWTDESIQLDKVADVNNDSVYQLVIPDIATFYPSLGSETVFRIMFIARGHSGGGVSGQSPDKAFEVFEANPTTAAVSHPASPNGNVRMTIDFNIKAASDQSVATYIAAHPTDTLYAHTGINTTNGNWQHVVADWNVNLAKNRLLKVSDSIYRIYIEPSARSYYGVLPAEGTNFINIIVRIKNGPPQTEEYHIPVLSAPQVDMSLAVNGLLCYPPYPTMADHIYIFVNANAYVQVSTGNKLDPTSTLSTWSGVTTTASANNNDWQHQVNGSGNWGTIPDSTLLLRLNDSVQYWDIPSLATTYHLNAGEKVYQISFIARDTVVGGGIGHQTDNIYFEVYGSVPTALVGTQPAKLKEDGQAVYTFNINQSSDKTLKDYIATSHNDTVGIYTGVYNTVSPADSSVWEHVVAQWSDVPTTPSLQTIAINDSIFRFYVMGSLRGLYGVDDTCDHIRNTNMVLRSNNTGQTQNIYVAIDTIATCKGVVSIFENKVSDIAGITVYPNPVTEYMTFSFEKGVTGTIEIYNIHGQKLYSVDISDQQTSVKINMGDINTNSSVLIYRVSTAEGSAFGKFIYQK
jgi:hypothetical protein